MRQRIAWCLRQWADLIDSRVEHSHDLTIRINCDTSRFDEEMRRVQKSISGLREQSYPITESDMRREAHRAITDCDQHMKRVFEVLADLTKRAQALRGE